MAQGYIKLEIDRESLSRVKSEMHELYGIADNIAKRIEGAQRSVYMSTLRRGLTASIIANVILLAVVISTIAGK